MNFTQSDTSPRRLLLPLAVVLLAIWAMGCALLAMRSGIGLVGDSVDYIAATRQVMAGGGLKTLDGQGGFVALRQFPPGYSLALAMWATLTRQDAVQASVSFNAATLGMAVLLTAGVTWRWNRSSFATITTAALMAGTSPLLPLATRLLSEVPFILLCLSVMHLLMPTRGRPLPTWRMTVLAGLFLLMAAVPWLLMAFESWTRKGSRAVLLIACSTALPLAWAARNVAISGEATSRQLAFHPPGWSAAVTATQTLAAWTLPVRWPINGVTLIVVLVAIAFAMMARDRFATRWRTMIGLLMAAYLLMLLIVSTWFDAAMPWNYRILAPLYPLGLIATIQGGEWIVRTINGPRAVRLGAAIVLIVALGAQLMLGLKWARRRVARATAIRRPLGVIPQRWRGFQIIRRLP